MEKNEAYFRFAGLQKFLLYLLFSCVLDICSTKAATENSYSSCESKECLQHANNIIKYMKPTIDPCSDFYTFACGGYMNKFVKNETRTVYDDNWDSLQIQIKTLLETIQPEDGSLSNKLKTVYENCMNVGHFDLMTSLTGLYYLHHIFGFRFNFRENFRSKDFHETLGRLATYEEFAFITFKSSPYVDEDNPKSLPPALILPGNFLLNSKMKHNEVKKLVQGILEYFPIINENEKEVIWENFKAVEDIGMRLQNAEIKGSNRCGNASRQTYIEVNCSEEIQGNLKHLCKVWKSAVKYGKLDRHFLADIIHVSCRWYHFHYFEKIFSYLEEINDRSLADYLTIRFYLSHMDDLNFNLTKKTYPDDKKSTTKTSEPLKRWEYCIGWIIKSMDSALGHVYTKKVVKEPVQKFINDVIKDYVEELRKNIEQLHWSDEKVRFYLLKQLKQLTIGFETTMRYFKNETLISNEYLEYEPGKSSRFLDNVLELQRIFATKKDKTQFNSFYSSSDPYSMDFGFSLLFPPTFLYGLPKLWNYATLGSVIGHELSHNFKYFFDLVHLDESTEKRLNKKIQCFMDQYSQFIKKKTGKRITSSETEEEIIADNLGWALTEKIVQEMDDKEFYTLPGLNYTPLQLMYISFAQDACAVLSQQVEDDFYATKPHNLQNLRILGILQNSRMFSETFKCSRGSTMNSESKCNFFD